MLNLIGWLIVGLIAGALARLILPGRDPMGILGTLGVGLAGSLVGGFLGSILLGSLRAFRPSGLIGSVVGAIIVLLIYRRTVDRSGART